MTKDSQKDPEIFLNFTKSVQFFQKKFYVPTCKYCRIYVQELLYILYASKHVCKSS